jgi:hypothetical protein
MMSHNSVGSVAVSTLFFRRNIRDLVFGLFKEQSGLYRDEEEVKKHDTAFGKFSGVISAVDSRPLSRESGDCADHGTFYLRLRCLAHSHIL